MLHRYSRRDVIKGGAALAGLALAACAPSTQQTTPSGGVASAPSQFGPKRGGIVRTAFTTEPPHLDPALESSYTTHGGPGAPYSRLIRYKVGPDVTFQSRVLEPDLAISWEQPDPVTYVMKLRQGVKWQNKAPLNGRLFTAEDAKWALEFYADRTNKNVFQSSFAGLKTVTVVDPQTVRVTLNEPQSFFLDNVLASHFTKMLPREVWDKDGSFKNYAVGTGPFMLDRWDRGVKMSFVRNPEYFEPGKPYIDGFEWVFQPDYATRVSLLRAGEIDYGPEPTGPQNEDLESIKRAQPSLIWNKQIRANMYWLNLNLTRKPFDDVRVRQAISLAIDRTEIVKALYFEDGLISSILPPALTDWLIPEAEVNAAFAKRDVVKAKQLLAAAGYPNGFEAEFLPRELNGAELALSEMVAAMLKDVGITTTFKMLTRPDWTQALVSKTYQVAQGIGQTSFEPDDWTYGLYHSKSQRNTSGFNDPKADALMEKQRVQTNLAERKQTIFELQRYLNEQLPVVPLVYRYEQMPHFPYLKNFRVHWSYCTTYLRECYIDK